MKKYDNLLGGFLLIFGAIYIYMALQLPQKMRVYPLIMASVFMFLTVLLLIQNHIKGYKETKDLFANFKTKQFFFVLFACFIYVLLINILGFYASTFLYLVFCLTGLKIKPYHAAIVSIIFCFVVYGVFSSFLKVPLPKGFII